MSNEDKSSIYFFFFRVKETTVLKAALDWEGLC